MGNGRTVVKRGRLNHSRIYGCIIGTAVGDAIGELSCYDSKPGLANAIGKADMLSFTDDTMMTLGICQLLIEENAVDTEALSEIFMKDLLSNPERGYGTGAYVLYNIRKNLRSSESISLNKKVSEILYKNSRGSYGNGACMRVAPIGLWFSDYVDSTIRRNARRTAIATHIHPLAIDSAAIMAKAASMACRTDRVDPDVFLEDLIRVCRTNEFRVALTAVRTAIMENVATADVAKMFKLNEAAVESLPFSLFCFLNSPNSFGESLENAVLHAGDSDTLGAMACALSGAYLGIEAIPREYVQKIEKIDYLYEVCEVFIDALENRRPNKTFGHMKSVYFPELAMEEGVKVGLGEVDAMPLTKALRQLREEA
jgi:poly(ADP-ribose) glycohydrolase ARH3